MLQNKLNALGWGKTTLNRKWTLFTSIVQSDYLGEKTSEIAQKPDFCESSIGWGRHLYRY
jgi:hypothetical protein